MTFFLYWTPARCRLLGVGVPKDFARHVESTLAMEMRFNDDGLMPCSLYPPVLEVLLSLYDASVWAIRNIIRVVEQVQCLGTMLKRCT